MKTKVYSAVNGRQTNLGVRALAMAGLHVIVEYVAELGGEYYSCGPMDPHRAIVDEWMAANAERGYTSSPTRLMDPETGKETPENPSIISIYFEHEDDATLFYLTFK